jgi:MHS family alpha-ketoglutarate permease-like MFS transporter
MRELFAHHRRAFLVVLGHTASGSPIFHTFTSYTQKHLVNSAVMSIETASHVMTVRLFLYMCIHPLFGALSDRIGRRTDMLLFDALGALITLTVAVVSLCTSISGIVKAEMFPPQVRALGVGLAYAVGNALFGGTAESVALGLKSLDHEPCFYWYVTAMMAIAFRASLLPKQAAYLYPER